jgi:hypothetical protein
MDRYLLLLLLIAANIAYSQSYEISFSGYHESDSTHTVTIFNNAANGGTIKVTEASTNHSLNNFGIDCNGCKIEKKGVHYFIDPENNPESILIIYKGKKKIGRLTFKAERPPAPGVDFITTGKTTLSNGFFVNLNEPVSFIFHPDSAFARACPSDTNYTASEITVVRNGNIRKSQNINGSFKLNDFGLAPGETIKLELNRYQRINYKGEALIEEASPEDFLILKIR